MKREERTDDARAPVVDDAARWRARAAAARATSRIRLRLLRLVSSDAAAMRPVVAVGRMAAVAVLARLARLARSNVASLASGSTALLEGCRDFNLLDNAFCLLDNRRVCLPGNGGAGELPRRRSWSGELATDGGNGGASNGASSESALAECVA